MEVWSSRGPCLVRLNPEKALQLPTAPGSGGACRRIGALASHFYPALLLGTQAATSWVLLFLPSNEHLGP